MLMHFFRRIATVFVAVFLLCFYCANPACSEQLSVTVVLSENSGAHLEFSNALREHLRRKNITPLVIEYPAVPSAKSGLVISVGMKAATVIAASNVPAVLNVLIPKSGYEKLLHDYPQRAHSKNYSAIFLDQPLARQANLIVAALPGRQRIGVLYSNARGELAQLTQVLKERKLGLYDQAVSPALPLHEALQNLLKDSEVLLALPDAEIYNSSTIRNILLATYRSSIPLIGFSPGYVKAGALCAIYSTPEQLAAQAASLIKKFSETQTISPAQYPHEFEVAVNEQVARSLGLRLKSAAGLQDAVQALERNEP